MVQCYRPDMLCVVFVQSSYRCLLAVHASPFAYDAGFPCVAGARALSYRLSSTLMPSDGN